MSRLCVKNLPKYVNEERLREFFSRKGEVTDAKVMRTNDRKSRQFAFVGFRTEEEAQEAINYFNNSYMDTCKITCEVARKVGDANMPRPWSRYSTKKDKPLIESTKIKKGIGAVDSSPAKLDGQDLSDPKLQEFLHAMQPRSKSQLWGNDIVTGVDQDTKVKEKGADEKKQKEKKMPGGITNLPPEEDAREEETDTDMDYFKSKVKENWSESESESESSEAEGTGDSDAGEDEPALEGPIGEESEGDEEQRRMVLDTGRLFVRNLPYTATEEELGELFGEYGDVTQVHLVVDRDTKRSKGIGYVLFTSPEFALRALEELDKSIFQGRLLHVMPAKPLKNEKLEMEQDTSGNKKSLKKLREEKRKEAEASGDTRAWNSFFMRHDTILENIARKNGIRKTELLDREADDLAVRMALGETHVIAETKKSFSNSGVNVSALEEFASKRGENTAKRSNHVLLVKNLPYSCSESDLTEMFGKFGSLERVVLPPTRALALVIFLEATEARSAFKGLAYKRYKDAPLYLEWAPENILSPDSKLAGEEQKDEVIGEKNVQKVLLQQHLEGVAEDEDIDPDRVESRSVFVKNLNFKTSVESLKQHFTNNLKSGTIKSVKIKMHLKNGKNVSMGFGFIEFDSVETATNVCKDLQGTVLDGHALILELCHAKSSLGQAPKKSGKDESSTKLIVRNVAFEATAKDLRQLFSPFGQIKSIRLPMKFGSHRGFAFVEYVTKQEAQNAMQSLSDTHLYGRHLVIERAKEGESLEELRARTAAQFVDEHSGFKTLSRKRKQMGLLDEGTIKFSKIVE